MPLPKEEKKNCFGNCGNAIADNVKKIYIYIYIYILANCGNPIADNAKKKKKKKIFWQLWQCHCRKCKKKIVLAIVAMTLSKM